MRAVQRMQRPSHHKGKWNERNVNYYIYNRSGKLHSNGNYINKHSDAEFLAWVIRGFVWLLTILNGIFFGNFFIKSPLKMHSVCYLLFEVQLAISLSFILEFSHWVFFLEFCISTLHWSLVGFLAYFYHTWASQKVQGGPSEIFIWEAS